MHNIFFNFFNHWVGRSTGTNQCYNPLESRTFLVYISTWNKPLFPVRTPSYLLSPTSYPVCLLQQSCLLEKFHQSSAGCHISPRSYTTAVFTFGFSSSGSEPSGLNISNHGILPSSWMQTSSHTFAGFKDKMWWQVFRYIFWNPACSSSRMPLSRDGAPVGKTFRFPAYGQIRNPYVISTGWNWKPSDLRYFIGDLSGEVNRWESIATTVLQ